MVVVRVACWQGVAAAQALVRLVSKGELSFKGVRAPSKDDSDHGFLVGLPQRQYNALYRQLDEGVWLRIKQLLEEKGLPSIEVGHLPALAKDYEATQVQLLVAVNKTSRLHKVNLAYLEWLIGQLFADTGIAAEVVPVDMGSDGNEVKELPRMRAAVDAMVARLVEPVAGADGVEPRQPTSFVNAVSGTSLAKNLLLNTCIALGVPQVIGERKDPDTYEIIRPPLLQLAEDKVNARIDLADWLCQQASTDPERREALEATAGELELEQFVNWSGRTPQLSSFARSLEDRLRIDPPTPYSFGADLLEAWAATRRDAHAEAARRYATALRELVSLWVDQRLWSLNLVPELVLHDDRHVSRVDRLAMQMAAPLLQKDCLKPVDVFHLSCAAWLHDWGHVGAHYGAEGRRRFVIHPLEVRLLHGELTRSLLLTNATQHGLENQRLTGLEHGGSHAEVIGILCAHHQGASCCGAGVPRREMADLASQLGAPLPTLSEDRTNPAVTKLMGNRGARARLELLVALLRVADAADLGAHRVPHFASQAQYLDHCTQKTAQITLLELEDPVRHDKYLDSVGEQPRAELAGLIEGLRRMPSDPATLSSVKRLDLEGEETLERIRYRFVKYMELVEMQAPHYEKHTYVAGVRFTCGPRGVTAVVRPSEPRWARAAKKAVNLDIRRELRSGRTCTHVADVLDGAGLRYLGAEVT